MYQINQTGRAVTACRVFIFSFSKIKLTANLHSPHYIPYFTTLPGLPDFIATTNQIGENVPILPQKYQIAIPRP
jgi:hypothetical protein